MKSRLGGFMAAAPQAWSPGLHELVSKRYGSGMRYAVSGISLSAERCPQAGVAPPMTTKKKTARRKTALCKNEEAPCSEGQGTCCSIGPRPS